MSNYNQRVHYGQTFSPSPEFGIPDEPQAISNMPFEPGFVNYTAGEHADPYPEVTSAKMTPLYRQPAMAATTSTFSSSSPTIGQDRQTAPTPTSVFDDSDRFTSPNISHFNRRASAGTGGSPTSALPTIPNHPLGLNIPGFASTSSYSHNDLGFFEPPVMPASHNPYQHMPSNDISMNLSEFLKQDPFKTSSDPSQQWPPVKFSHCHDDLSDLLENETDFPRNFPHHEEFSSPQGFESPRAPWLEEKKSVKKSSTNHSTPALKGEKSPQAGTNSPRRVRKAKSFTAGSYKFNSMAGPAFSLQDCSNEFHMSDGMITFQDETARVSKQAGQSPPTKRKSSSKLPKTLSTLRKTQTMTNLYQKAAVSPESKSVRKMESGLVSFQVNLNNEDD